MQQSGSTSTKATEKMLGQIVFSRTEHDNKPAPSVEDTAFLKIMGTNVYRNDANSCVAPLPFREPCQRLPNNKEQVVNRFTCLQRTLKRNPEERDDHCKFLRFLWHKDNDVNKEIIEYRMKGHVFGNRPSPAVAIYGL